MTFQHFIFPSLQLPNFIKVYIYVKFIKNYIRIRVFII